MSTRARALLTAVALPLTATAVANAASAVTPAPPAPQAATRTTGSTQRAAGLASYTNWTGYQMRVPAPQEVHATWTVPTVSWQGRDGYSNQWVGIGGGNTAQGQLIQAGTEHDAVCTAAAHGRCRASRSTYSLWLETFPQRSQEKITNLVIRPGDRVDVTVRYSPRTRTAEFTLCNLTRNACVEASRPTSAPRDVVEDVVERPTDAAGRQLALANYRSASFTGMSAKSSLRAIRPSALPMTRITMFNGRMLASSGALSADGRSFSTWYHRAV